jgi:hypothetical protein
MRIARTAGIATANAHVLRKRFVEKPGEALGDVPRT